MVLSASHPPSAAFAVEFYDYPTHTVANLRDARGRTVLRAMCAQAVLPMPERHATLKRWFEAAIQGVPLPPGCVVLRDSRATDKLTV